MFDVKLYTRDGRYVITLTVPPLSPPAEVIAWGQRVFVRNEQGHYCEGLLWHAQDDHLAWEPADTADLF
jgi:hypothetical protein